MEAEARVNLRASPRLLADQVCFFFFFTQVVVVSASPTKHLLLHPLQNVCISVLLFVYELKDATRVKLDIFLNFRGVFHSMHTHRERDGVILIWSSYHMQILKTVYIVVHIS